MAREGQGCGGRAGRVPPGTARWLAVICPILAGVALLPGPVLFLAALSGSIGLGVELAVLRRDEAARRPSGGARSRQGPRPGGEAAARPGAAAWPAGARAIPAA